jgi:hypothetical protein
MRWRILQHLDERPQFGAKRGELVEFSFEKRVSDLFALATLKRILSLTYAQSLSSQ